MADEELIKGPSDTRKTILVIVDPVEGAVIRDALTQYQKNHEGPVADICEKLEAAFNWSLA